MPTTGATLDPADTIAAAIRELYVQLCELVERGPTDDPGLLDELGKLTGRIRSRITRARKRVQDSEPERVPAPAVAPTPTTPAPALAWRQGSDHVAARDGAIVTSTPAATVPAAIAPTSTAGERVSVRLAEPPTPAPRPAAPTVAASRGRHRLGRRRRWLIPILLVAAVLGLVATMLLACTTDTTAAQDTPRTPRAVSIRPDVVLTAPLRPMNISLAGSHAAFPGLTQTSDGTLTVAWRQGSDHVAARDGAIVTATSLDTGLTYHNPTTVLDNSVDRRDPSLSTIGGEVWLTYFDGTRPASSPLAGSGLLGDASGTTGAASNGAEGAYVIRGARPPVRIDQLPYAAISAPAVTLPDGSVGAVYYGRAGVETRDSAWFARSTDGGATWSSTRIANGQADGRDYQEPWLVVRNGTLHVLHRHGNWDAVGITSSTDGGATWSTPRRILAKATGRPTTIVFTSGTMAVIYRHTDTRAAMMATSRNGGLTWVSTGPLLSPSGPLGMTYAAADEVLPGVAHVVIGGENPDGSSTLHGGWLAEASR